MTLRPSLFPIILAILQLFPFSQADSQAATKDVRRSAPLVCSRCIRAHEEFLASDAMNGRGSATHDELVAATYIASQLRQYGIAPAAGNGGYISEVPLLRKTVTSAPELRFADAGTGVVWTHGQEMLAVRVGATDMNGPLRRIEAAPDSEPTIHAGDLVLLSVKSGSSATPYSVAKRWLAAGATLIMIRETKSFRDYWQPMTEKLYGGKIVLPDVEPEQKGTILVLTDAAFSRLQGLADGTELRFTAPERQEHATSWNVIGKLAGSDVSLAHEGVLFSAHLDHLGVGKPMNGDSIYNGADDDASGVTAVLELARVLGQTKPRRPVWFVLFGSEEPGILGSEYFRKHPPMPLTDLAANLEFEMIGRRDPKLPADTLWMTGWKRTNLGPALVARGAHLVADPYPDQHYFERSDNLRLAQGGVVAQTISSYGLHEDYHQPSDDIAHLDFQHMETAIGSLLGPIQWLVNSNFKPEWMKGGKP